MNEEEHGSEELWEELFKIMKETAESYIPKRQKLRKPWLTEDMLDIVKKRREAKADENQEEWRDSDKKYNQ